MQQGALAKLSLRRCKFNLSCGKRCHHGSCRPASEPGFRSSTSSTPGFSYQAFHSDAGMRFSFKNSLDKEPTPHGGRISRPVAATPSSSTTETETYSPSKKSKKAAKKFNRYLDLYGLRLGLVCMKPVFDRRGSSDPRSLQLHSNPLTHRCTRTVPGL